MNSPKYDGQFLVHEVLRGMQDLEPGADVLDEVEETERVHEMPIFVGRKVYSMRVGEARLVDSLNFIPAGLDTFPKQFGLTELKKGYFPYLFNVPENYGYRGLVPDLKFYDPMSKTPAKRAALERWHAEQLAGPDPAIFEFIPEILGYCFSDVILLAEGGIAFSKQFEANAGVSPFIEATTAASTALLTYRRMGLAKDTLMVDRPENLKLRQSKEALVAIDWYKEQKNWEVLRDARHPEGEFQIASYFVDALIKLEDTDELRVFEYKGCYYHQHECRYRDSDMMHGEPAWKIRDRDRLREIEIERAGYPIISVWSCQVDREREEDPDMEEFFRNTEIKAPISIRNSFRGGCVEGFKQWFKPDLMWSAKYFDFCSLYPYIQKYRRYPVGGMRTISGAQLPQLIADPAELKRHVDGFLFCRVRPPTTGYLPVLPATVEGKLKFAYCLRCAAHVGMGEERHVIHRTCPHTDEEREFEGTWATCELELALRKGYTIVCSYEAVHYTKWLEYKRGESDGLFSKYIDKFLLQKVEASGWPAGVATEAQKREHLAMWLDKEGIEVNADRVASIPPTRAVTKLLLNSLWGKMGENPNKSRTIITNSYHDFMQIIEDSTIEIQDVVIIPGSDRVKITLRREGRAVEPLNTNSIAIASLTTAYARCRLYEALERIAPENLLYCDTDSVIFAARDDEPNPLGDLVGEIMGRMTDELPGMKCIEFVTQGPKVYALRCIPEGTTPETAPKETVKCRGFPLTSEASESINFASIVRNVEGIMRPSRAPVPPKVPIFRIEAARDHTVTSKTLLKSFGAVWDKRVVGARAGIPAVGPPGSPATQGYDTLPFGYRSE